MSTSFNKYWNPTGGDDGSGGWEDNEGSDGNARVNLGTTLSGERNEGTPNQYFASVGEWNYTICTGDVVITENPALIHHVIVTVATATDIIEIRDASSAGTGTVVDTIPAGTAVQTKYEFEGYKFNTGLVIDFAATATGTVRVAWRDQ